MKIIDIHSHIYPEHIAMKAADNVRNFYHIPGGMNGTAEMLFDRGREAGISQYLVLPVAVKPDRVHSINDFILGQLEKHDCLIGFGTVHADMDYMETEVERVIRAGLRGIKLHPDCQHFAIDDPRLFPLYDLAEGRFPIAIHMGDTRYDYSHPSRLRRVLKEFPRLETLAAHFGGYSMYETARENLQDTECIMDISSSLPFMPQGMAEKYIDLYGAERMAFGTDYPVWDPVEEVKRFLDLDLSSEQKEQIAHKTAERFLKL